MARNLRHAPAKWAVGFRVKTLKSNMAARRGKRSAVTDYRQLNALTSCVLYDTRPKKIQSKLYSIERIIKRRKKSKGYEYPIKWEGWDFQSCTWEPSENLTPALLRSYEKPLKPDMPKFQQACRNFVHAVHSGLKSKSAAPIYINMDLDVWRYITCNVGIESNHKGHKLFEKDHFKRFEGLPDDWHYILNRHGDGVGIDFPLKAKPMVSWTPAKYIVKNGKLIMGARIPIEKIVISFAKRARNMYNI